MAQTENIDSGRCGTRFTGRALAASIGLGALFLIVYGWCNWFTAQRANVPTLFFEWERSIPFVPLMIIPYMSIDLFFVTAPFLCRSNRELVAFSKRMAAALLIAGLCFLLFPLRFAFERSPLSGWLGTFYDWFQGIDRPHNLLPSLHIALCLILAEKFARHTRGLLRHALIIWFVVIGFSAVLTYQHHVLDVVAGFALGAYCLYFCPESAARLPVVPNRRVGSYYLVGTFVNASLAVLLWPWGAFLIWPTVSLGIAATAYFGAGPGIFRKGDGRLPWTTWWALGPVLLGQEISRLYYRRQGRAWDELTPRVWIGGVLTAKEAGAAVRQGLTAVLDLTSEFSETAPFRSVTYRNIPILDLTAPTFEQLVEMAAFIEEESSRGIVYVHCKIGYSRTGAAAIASLLRTGKVRTVSEAIHLLRQVRPAIVIRPEVMTALDEFATRLTVSPRLHEALLQ
ncbi:MAG: phosphatase PAP2/dual specificity phosphatase family protein [Verrucomicrobiota bacterium]|nr:phosphatase PAP2/dual specificity phosphatase family protein [Verrucomicrobiota bacterium]